VAENSLRQYRETEGVVSLAEQARSAISQNAELQARHSALDAERSALAQLLVNTDGISEREGGTGPYRNLVAFPSLFSNMAVSGLLTSLANIEDRRTDLLTRRKPSDPEVQILTERIVQLETQLHDVATTYLNGLADQVQAIDLTLAQSRGQMARIPNREIALARLERDAGALQEIVTLLTSRLKEAEIAEAVEDPSVRLVDLATIPSRPARQGMLLLLAVSVCVGVLFGVAGAFVREYGDSAVHTRGDTQIATGVPCWG
jgi:tyrosine-protein kinase Etk/Wzc